MLDKDLQYEEGWIAILECDVRRLRTKGIMFVMIQWKSSPVMKLLGELKGICEISIPNSSLVQVLLHSFLSLFFLSLSLGGEWWVN